MPASPVLTFRLSQDITDAEAAVRAALQEQGFGVLTEVDVAATLRSKLGVQTTPHRLLGVCNPTIAHRALQAEPAVGAFLPCGLSLRAVADGSTIVTLQDPALMATAFGSPALGDPASEAKNRLVAALSSVGEVFDAREED
jgi:uncharacterized protein (DUF302 family)